jgi:hydrogenase nickel incorporation protein HypA/HybF
MHELSIAMSILDVADEEAQKYGNVRVRGIHLKLGPLSGVIEGPLRGAFEIARESSRFPDVELFVEAVPLLIDCPLCRATRSVASLQQLCCSECGTFTSDLVGGRELEVVALEIE